MQGCTSIHGLFKYTDSLSAWIHNSYLQGIFMFDLHEGTLGFVVHQHCIFKIEHYIVQDERTRSPPGYPIDKTSHVY